MGKRDEFEDFVAARFAALARTAFLFVGDRGHAEDLAQAALLRTYSHWRRLGSAAAADAYTRRTMARLAGRWSRRPWHGEIPTVAPGEHDAVDPLAVRAGVLDLYVALGRLPWSQRAVLVLRYFEGLSEAETAAVLRCSPGTVKSRSSRALAALRTSLGVELVEGDTALPKEAPHA